MGKLIDKLKKNSTLDEADILQQSKFFNNKDMVQTAVPILNVALSGSLTGGLTPGVTMFAGPSKHFKTLFSLICIKAYMDAHPEAALLFYDSEFGTPKNYWKAMGIDEKRVLHTPLLDIEQLKVDIMNQLKDVGRGENLIIAIDSIGNLASKKEVDDAEAGKSVADMTRAKQLKSLFRMVTPHLNLKDIPMLVVNHTYKEIGLFPKDIVGGGTGSYYSADNIFIVGRQQEKKDKDILGYHFILNVEKSRYVKEKSKIPVTVMFNGGVNKWSGLLDLAQESGHVSHEGRSYIKASDKKRKWSEEDTNTDDFWDDILNDPKFQEFIVSKYQLKTGMLDIDPDEVEE